MDKRKDELNEYKLSKGIEKNIKTLKEIFKDDDNLKIRKIVNQSNAKFFCYIAFFDGMIDSKIINDNIIKPFLTISFNKRNVSLTEIGTQVIQINELKESNNIKEIVASITSGDTILFFNKEKKVLILNTKGYDYRAISEPESEKVLIGPREGFTESLIINVALLQRKFRTNQLKVKYMGIGQTTNTNVGICYIDNVVNKEILNKIYKKLEAIDIDAILDSNYIAELIGEKKYSIFKKISNSERPASVVGKLLEGRIAILVDGSPMVLIIPHLFIENFQNPEDYYIEPDYASISRIIRIIGFIITICTPALYVAIVAFHQEMIPTPLFINIAIDQQGTPLPAALEVIVMLFVFELIKEAGIRIPSKIGDALSIVGALVVGQAAVDARLVAAPLVIVVGITGISGLLIFRMEAPILIYRIIFLLASTFLGLVGFVLSFSILIINILSQESFGLLQVSEVTKFNVQNYKDIFIRKRWTSMILRPRELTKNKVRQSENEEQQ